MFLTDQFIYLQLPKTGSTHVTYLLEQLYENNFVNLGKHSQLKAAPEHVLRNFEHKIKLGNIRNPWDYYVSQWSYGCQKQGGLFKQLTRPRQKSGLKQLLLNGLGTGVDTTTFYSITPDLWMQLYSDPTNYTNFALWLKLILWLNVNPSDQGFISKTPSYSMGLFTKRYLRLYTINGAPLHLSSFDELYDYDKKNNVIDFFIRTEFMTDDLQQFLKKVGHDSYGLDALLSVQGERTNASSRDRDYRKYYNDDTAALVETYDRLVIKKHGYSFDGY
ncbi:hypothetical protein [Flagellimonas marinaquae]